MIQPTSIRLILDEDEIAMAHQGGRDAWWVYASEILDHVRLPYQVESTIDADTLSGVTSYVLLFPGPVRIDESRLQAIRAWVERGGFAVVCGDPRSLAGLAGIHVQARVDAGQVEFSEWPDLGLDVSLRSFGGVELAEEEDLAGTQVLGRWTNGAPAVISRDVGRGRIVYCGVDLVQSIVRIQQGWPIVADGVPAPDGTAPVDDGVLKCDDGVALSYSDRAVPSSEPESVDEPFPYVHPPRVAAPIFHRPHADLWRRVLLTILFDGAELCGAVLPWLGYWPAGVPAVAHMSQDMHSEPEVSDFARTALAVFAELGVRVTWCHTYPGGLDPELLSAIEAAGHEQAFHFNAMPDADITFWGWRQIRAQYAWAQALTGRDDLVTNKNHFTRWEGWHEFFLWCERLGIQIDQSRGGSKQGNFGFTFGSSHLHFPIADAADRNRRIDVLELPLHTQDLARHAHPAVGAVILDQALAEHGVAHFLYHARWLHLSEDVRDCCLRTVEGARDRGMPWWTSRELNDWERKRRGVRLTARAQPNGDLVIDIYAQQAVQDSAILLAPPRAFGGGIAYYAVSIRTPSAQLSKKPRVSMVRRHGRQFVEIAVDLPPGQSILTCKPTTQEPS